MSTSPHGFRCMTRAKIAAAENSGASFVKVFPGKVLSSGFYQRLKELFSGLKFIVTDCVEAEEENLRAVQCRNCRRRHGQQTDHKSILENKEYSKIIQLTREAMSIIQTIQK
jgi:2-dehydro-3-deoxyphosphogluconate aldolase/(4S)-4-hydroxy-2-oxoglutarate aldolase